MTVIDNVAQNTKNVLKYVTQFDLKILEKITETSSITIILIKINYPKDGKSSDFGIKNLFLKFSWKSPE